MSAEPHQRLYFHPQNLLTKKDLSHNFPFVQEMSTDTAAATENDFTMEMLDQCRFYVEGVALLPVSIIGIIGNEFANVFLQRKMPSICFVNLFLRVNLKTAVQNFTYMYKFYAITNSKVLIIPIKNQKSTYTYLNEFSIFNALLFHKSFCLNN